MGNRSGEGPAPVALVTGASRGIGRAISVRLAAEGMAVAVNYRRDEDAAARTDEQIVGAGGLARAYRASVEDGDELARMVRRIEEELGPIGTLVNNAGLASRGLGVADTDGAEVERLLRVHAVGPFVLARLVLPSMRAAADGAIVMVSSRAAQLSPANSAPYNMAKAAMESLAFTLAKEERRHGIRVNVVAPGLVDTDMGRRAVLSTMGVTDIRHLDDGCDGGRVCEPEDVAETVAFLVSPRARYVWGERVTVHSGDPFVRDALGAGR